MHEGHRKRMLAKVESGALLYDHEVLEILLFNACPRINTNPLAHALLERFCSLSGVLGASVAELKEVKGVGENVAMYLRTVGLCLGRAGRTQGLATLKNLGDCVKFVSMRLKGRKEEFLELYMLDKSGCVTRVFTYTSADRNRVTADSGEIVKSIVNSAPFGILIAHNHVNGNANPSENDDEFTKIMQLICNMNNVVLWDHIIYAGEVFSYKDSGRLERISANYTLKSVLKWTKTSNST